MAAPNTDNFAHGIFLGQKKAKSGENVDPDLATESEFQAGDSDDPDRAVDSEALGLRHRRRFGYSAEGAEENDLDILAKGRKPLKVAGHKQQNVGESRIAHFNHSVTATRHPTTIVKNK